MDIFENNRNSLSKDSIIPDCSKNKGTIVYEPCDSRTFIYILTDDGLLYDLYFAEGVNYKVCNGSRVNFDFIDADFESPCPDAIKAINVTCIEDIYHISKRDSLALIDLYDKCNGANWRVKWDFEEPIRCWDGITLNDSGRVEKIDLSSNNLRGDIPSKVGDLNSLISINLDANFLNTIPLEIGNLKNLNELSLIANNLTTLPVEIGQLDRLNRLGLSQNKLEEIPVEIGKLINLINIKLYNNNLKLIPSELGNLTKLTQLNLSNNDLKTLPNEIGNLNLTGLNLNNNDLETLPNWLQSLENLEWINLCGNNLKFKDFLPFIDKYSLGPTSSIDDCYQISFNDSYTQTELSIDCDNPQLCFQSISSDSLIVFDNCDSPQIILQIEPEITNSISIYSWKKNDSLIYTTNENSINLKNIFNNKANYGGVYNVEVTNNFFKDVVLVRNLTVKFENSYQFDTIQIRKKLYIGMPFDTLGYTFDCSNSNKIIDIPILNEGCFKILDFQLECDFFDADIILPSSFTPNGDGYNDTFIIPSLVNNTESFQKNQLSIYNQIGTLLFRTNSYSNNWDGRNLNGEDLPVGTYYYQFEYGNNKSLKGVITIIR